MIREESSGNSLYEFNLVTGAILGSSILDTQIQAYGLSSRGLVGLDFNSGTGNWEYRTINSGTGATTLLNSFSLANGFTEGTFLTDSSTGSAYLMSVNELYDLNLASGDVIGTSTVDTSMAVIGISPVPEPSTALLMGLGVLGIALVRIRAFRALS